MPLDLLRLHGGAETRVLRLHLALQVAAVILLVHRAGDRRRRLLRVLAHTGLRDSGLGLPCALRSLGAFLQQDRLLRSCLLNAERHGLRSADSAGGLGVQAGEVTGLSVEPRFRRLVSLESLYHMLGNCSKSSRIFPCEHDISWNRGEDSKTTSRH